MLVIPKPGSGSCRNGIARRLWRDAAAVAALEFAITGPFCLLLIATTIETGVILFTQAALDNATRDAARLVLIGQAPSAASFARQLCSEVGKLVPSCASTLHYTVLSGASFAEIDLRLGAAGTGNAYTPGTAGADMVVRVVYDRPFLVPWVGHVFGGGPTLPIVSTVAFRNEPYS